jgi:uncharacterized Zn finger protein
MAMRFLPSVAYFCPQCGQRMTTIRVVVPRQPFVLPLCGCERCGITLNELPRPEFPPVGARLCDRTTD